MRINNILNLNLRRVLRYMQNEDGPNGEYFL